MFNTSLEAHEPVENVKQLRFYNHLLQVTG